MACTTASFLSLSTPKLPRLVLLGGIFAVRIHPPLANSKKSEQAEQVVSMFARSMPSAVVDWPSALQRGATTHQQAAATVSSNRIVISGGGRAYLFDGGACRRVTHCVVVKSTVQQSNGKMIRGDDLITSFAQQRQVLLKHTADILRNDTLAPETASDERESRLSAILVSSLEELKVAEEELLERTEAL